MTPMNTNALRLHGSKREEGAVLLIVMLVILTTTALAVFAVRSTTTEIRAAGYYRMQMQSQKVGESGLVAAMAWVDFRGPKALEEALQSSENASQRLDMEPLERNVAIDRHAYRLYATDFNIGPVQVVDQESAVGSRQIYQPQVLVDIYDDHTYPGVLAGYRSDGYGRLQFIGATYTSRGRLQLPSDTTTVADTRPFYEGASDARARGLSGPYSL